MKKISILLLILGLALHIFGEVNDTFSHHGIRYQVTKENPAAQAFEVGAVYYDSAYIFLPDSVVNGEHSYAVTNAIQWYNPQNCGLRHYLKIDMSEAKHITSLTSQRSGLIAIDTLILPPNLERFPSWFNTTDSLKWRTELFDADTLLPGIHRIWSTGTQALEDIHLSSCTSLLEADLSTYTSTLSTSMPNRFSNNPFLKRLVIPNTVTTFASEIFYGDKRLTDLNIPDSLTYIYNILTDNIPMDTLRLGKIVSYIDCVFADGWHDLRHIKVDSANPCFMDDKGVLYTKNQSTLKRYPYTRDASLYKMSPETDSLCSFAFGYFWPEAINPDDDYVPRIKALVDSIPLKELECSTKLTYLGYEGTFFGSSIRTINKFGENRVKEIPIICFKYAAIDSIALPIGLTDIGNQAFAFTYNLRTISNLSSLKNLRFIGEGAFRDAWKLDSVDLLPCDKLLDIPESMCINDSALRFVSLPRNVQTIGDNAFKDCSSLQQIVCPAIVPIEISSNVFEGVDKQNCVLKVPARSLSLYQNAPVWQEFFHIDASGFYYIETAVSDTLAGSVTGGGAYFAGDRASVSADANPGYRFVSWSDDYPYSIRFLEVTQDESFTAIFEPIPVYSLTVVVNDDTMGSVTGSGEYEEGTEVTLTATPNEGYRFVTWSDGHPYSTRIVTVTHDESFTAIFEPIPLHTLSVVANDDTMGSVTGSGEYEEGTEVTLTATPNEGYCLLSWSFSDQAADTIVYTIPSSDTVVTAFFGPCHESVEHVEHPAPSASKILFDDQIFILRCDRTYTITGQEVK